MLHIDIYSFSYKKSGIPKDNTDNGGGFVFDCRGILNPGRIDEYKPQTGADLAVQEYLEEGTAMHHCVFSNEYYLKENSLILSATIEGRRIETIEVNLDTLKVVQSRGVCNKNTEYHDQIVSLVNANRKLIRQRMRATA